MTLNGIMAINMPHSVAFGADYVKVVEDKPHFLRRKCSAKNLVFSNVSLMAILAEVTENEPPEQLLSKSSIMTSTLRELGNSNR